MANYFLKSKFWNLFSRSNSLNQQTKETFFLSWNCWRQRINSNCSFVSFCLLYFGNGWWRKIWFELLFRSRPETVIYQGASNWDRHLSCVELIRPEIINWCEIIKRFRSGHCNCSKVQTIVMDAFRFLTFSLCKYMYKRR